MYHKVTKKDLSSRKFKGIKMVRKIHLKKNLNHKCVQAAETNAKTKLLYGSERMTHAEMKPRS